MPASERLLTASGPRIRTIGDNFMEINEMLDDPLINQLKVMNDDLSA